MISCSQYRRIDRHQRLELLGEYLVARMDGQPEGAKDGDDEMRFRIGPRLPLRGGMAAGTGSEPF